MVYWYSYHAMVFGMLTIMLWYVVLLPIMLYGELVC